MPFIVACAIITSLLTSSRSEIQLSRRLLRRSPSSLLVTVGCMRLATSSRSTQSQRMRTAAAAAAPAASRRELSTASGTDDGRRESSGAKSAAGDAPVHDVQGGLRANAEGGEDCIPGASGAWWVRSPLFLLSVKGCSPLHLKYNHSSLSQVVIWVCFGGACLLVLFLAAEAYLPLLLLGAWRRLNYCCSRSGGDNANPRSRRKGRTPPPAAYDLAAVTTTSAAAGGSGSADAASSDSDDAFVSSFDFEEIEYRQLTVRVRLRCARGAGVRSVNAVGDGYTRQRLKSDPPRFPRRRQSRSLVASCLRFCHAGTKGAAHVPRGGSIDAVTAVEGAVLGAKCDTPPPPAVSAATTRSILCDVSGSLSPKELVAIIGPSGAGKVWRPKPRRRDALRLSHAAAWLL